MSDVDRANSKQDASYPGPGGTTSEGASAARSDLEVGHWLVGVVDVLGQKAKFREIRDLPGDDASREQFVRNVRETFGVVEVIRHGFTTYGQAVAQTTEVFDALPEAVKPLALSLRRSDVRMRGISDSIVISVPFKNDDHFVTPINGVFESLFGMCGMAVVALSIGHPIRGAVDVGLAGEIEAGDLYGPAVARAAFMESSVAEYPRVLVGDELAEFIEAMSRQQGPSIQEQFARSMAQSVMKLVVHDNDGLLMLDFLGDGVRDVLGDDTEFLDRVRLAGEFVRESHDRFRRREDFKLGPRYGRLRRYFDARLPLWGLE